MSKINGILLFCFFSSIFLISCSESHRVIFIGESDHWRVQYNVNVQGTNSQSYNYTINYLGDKPFPEKINYSFEGPAGEDSGDTSFDNNSVLQIGGGSCSGCAVTRENDDIKATIKWDGNSEEFFLKNK